MSDILIWSQKQYHPPKKKGKMNPNKKKKRNRKRSSRNYAYQRKNMDYSSSNDKVFASYMVLKVHKK